MYFQELMEIFNSRKGYHLTFDEVRQASGGFLVFSSVQAAKNYERGDIDDVEDGMYYVPLMSKKTGKEYLACVDAKSITFHKRISELVRENHGLASRLIKMESRSNKNWLLSSVFTNTYKLLKTEMSLAEKYPVNWI